MSVLLRQASGFEGSGTPRVEPDAQNLAVAEHGHVAAEWRVLVQASEVAQRWHRQLDRDKPEPSIHDEIDRLLADESG